MAGLGLSMARSYLKTGFARITLARRPCATLFPRGRISWCAGRAPPRPRRASRRANEATPEDGRADRQSPRSLDPDPRTPPSDTVSTASSPVFLAHCAVPRSMSLRACRTPRRSPSRALGNDALFQVVQRECHRMAPPPALLRRTAEFQYDPRTTPFRGISQALGDPLAGRVGCTYMSARVHAGPAIMPTRQSGNSRPWTSGGADVSRLQQSRHVESFGLAVILGLAGLRIANQYERAVVFRLGRYSGIKGPGLYWLIPLIEWQSTVDLRIKTAAVEQQETITRDNVPIKINAVVWYRHDRPARGGARRSATSTTPSSRWHSPRCAPASASTRSTTCSRSRTPCRSAWSRRSTPPPDVGRQGRAGRDEERRDPASITARAIAPQEAEAQREAPASSRHRRARGRRTAATGIADHHAEQPASNLRRSTGDHRGRASPSRLQATLVMMPVEFVAAAGAIARLAPQAQ